MSASAIPLWKSPKLWIGLSVVLALMSASAFLDLKGMLQQVLNSLESLGPWAPVAFIGIYVFATVFFIPGFLLTVGSGVLFGTLWGTVYVSIASVSGAAISFLIGRYLARSWVEQQLDRMPKFKAVDRAIAKEGGKIVFLIRLSPLFPFNLLNYSLGLTSVSFQSAILASWIGMLPGTLLYVYLGSFATDLASLGLENSSPKPEQWALQIVGLLATIAVSIYVTKIAKKALNESALS